MTSSSENDDVIIPNSNKVIELVQESIDDSSTTLMLSVYVIMTKHPNSLRSRDIAWIACHHQIHLGNLPDHFRCAQIAFQIGNVIEVIWSFSKRKENFFFFWLFFFLIEGNVIEIWWKFVGSDSQRASQPCLRHMTSWFVIRRKHLL